jgi:hypothetical protein
MPCEDMLRLLDNFAFFVLVSSYVGLGIWLGSLSSHGQGGWYGEQGEIGSLVLAMGFM